MKNTMNPQMKRVPEDKRHKTLIFLGNYKMCSGDPQSITWRECGFHPSIFCKLIIQFFIRWSQMSNLCIFEAWLYGFWLAEVRIQIYIFFKLVFELAIVEIYIYQNWTCFDLFSLIYFRFVQNFPKLYFLSSIKFCSIICFKCCFSFFQLIILSNS